MRLDGLEGSLPIFLALGEPSKEVRILLSVQFVVGCLDIKQSIDTT